jgi:hypothetical protein
MLPLSTYYIINKKSESEEIVNMIDKSQETGQPQRCLTFEELNILKNIITLWTNYEMWTRSLMISTLLNLPQSEAVRNRVYNLPSEFYSTLRVFYGDKIAQQFSNYFQRYIVLQAQLIDALKNHDQNAADTYTRELYQSADEMAAFLGQFPNWDENQWKQYLYNDINLFLQEAIAFMQGDYDREIGIYERNLLNASDIGQYMARGILESGI